jgi:hypothetical protein
MSSKRLDRAIQGAQWARSSMNWAIRFRLAPGPFKSLRKVPLQVLCRVLQIQMLAIEKIAR